MTTIENEPKESKKSINFMDYIPTTWRSIIAVIVILVIPSTPFIKSGADGYVDARVENIVKPLNTKVDSLFIISKSRIESDVELRKSVESLNIEVRGLREWLIKNNKNNRD